LVSAASKRGSSTFGVGVDVSVSSIHSVVEWAKTSHGGKQYDFIRMEEGPSCSSIYGLCE
jgi:hypothetical protein